MSLIASGRMRVEDAIRADEYKDIARVHWEYRGKPTTKVGSIIKLRVPDRPSRILSIRGLADDRKGQILLDHVNRNEMGLNLGEEYEFTIETTNAWDKLKWACTSTDPAARIAAWIAIIFGVLAALGLLVALIGLYPVLREIGAGRDSHSPAPRSDVVEALNPLAIVVSPAYIFGLAAALCIVAAVIQACRNRIKSGWLLGTLFFVCAILAYFPQLDSIQAFMVNVKLKKNLDRAEEILDRLRHLSIISARSSYMSMAWSNRWGWPFANDKQRLLDQVDEQLADLKVAPEERVEITRPYTQLIGVDLFSIFHSVMERYTQWKEGELRSNLNGSSSPPAAFQQFTNDVQEWRSRSWPGPVGKLQSYDLEAELEIATPSKILDDDQTRRVQAFKDEILRMYKECKAKGGYTKETADFVDKYGHEPLGGADRKMAEVFGVAFEKH